ncbi:hypothetical protein DFS34DRAFT_594318 [Phlyctochytrium arcticum]|nr:hypothetical protein DFS34DRAFT_594318 [Phlyctochytrium arcticum]
MTRVQIQEYYARKFPVKTEDHMGYQWALSIVASQDKWRSCYDQNNGNVFFVHLVVFMDGFKIYKHRLKDMHILAISLAEFGHGIRNRSTSHAMAPISLLELSHELVVGFEFWANLLTTEMETLSRGFDVYNGVNGRVEKCILVMHSVIGDGPGRTSFLGFKSSSDLSKRMCHDCGILREHHLEMFLNHHDHQQRCECTAHRCSEQRNETAEIVTRLREQWHNIRHATHPLRIHAELYGIAYPSSAWRWPGLDPCCLAAVDFQHAVGEGEIQKERKEFSEALVLEYGEEGFWKQFDKKYRSFASQPFNRISQPQVSSWNPWRFGQTHENKLTFIVRSIAIVHYFVRDKPNLKHKWESWLGHCTRVEILLRHHLEKELLRPLYRMAIDGIKLGTVLYDAGFLTINSHYCTHIAEHAFRFGYPREFSTFGFESLISKFSMGRTRNTNHQSLANSTLENFWVANVLEATMNPRIGVRKDNMSPNECSYLDLPGNEELRDIVGQYLMDDWQNASAHLRFCLRFVDYREGNIVAYSR